MLLRLRTDDQLVALFRMGNEEAFRVIHDRYRTRLVAYARQMLAGSQADAEDALQDVFLRAYGTLRADDRPVTLRAWLYRVAHNRCIDHMRRPANQPAAELQDGALAGPGGDPWADLQHRDDLRQLVADVRRLPGQQRSALLMREMEGLSYAELGDALGVTVPAVKSLLVRARVGLVEAREARDTACVEIRADLAAAHGRGVKATARSRRHVRECSGCTEYRTALRRVREGVAALGPPPTAWGAVAKLLGLGGAVGGAAATAGGGGSAAATGLLAAGGTAKVAALVCCAAVVGGGAVEASHELAELAAPPATRAHARAALTHPAPVVAAALIARRLVHDVPPGAPAPAAHRTAALATPPPGPGAATRATPASWTAPAVATAPAADATDADHRTAADAGGALAPAETAEPEATPADPAAGAEAGVSAPDPTAAVVASGPGSGATAEAGPDAAAGTPAGAGGPASAQPAAAATAPVAAQPAFTTPR